MAYIVMVLYSYGLYSYKKKTCVKTSEALKPTSTNRAWLDLLKSQSDVAAVCRYKRSKVRVVMAHTVMAQTRMAVCRYQRSRAHIVMVLYSYGMHGYGPYSHSQKLHGRVPLSARAGPVRPDRIAESRADVATLVPDISVFGHR